MNSYFTVETLRGFRAHAYSRRWGFPPCDSWSGSHKSSVDQVCASLFTPAECRLCMIFFHQIYMGESCRCLYVTVINTWAAGKLCWHKSIYFKCISIILGNLGFLMKQTSRQNPLQFHCNSGPVTFWDFANLSCWTPKIIWIQNSFLILHLVVFAVSKDQMHFVDYNPLDGNKSLSDSQKLQA